MDEKNGAVRETEKNNTSENKISYFVLEGILNHFALIIKRIVAVLIVVIILWAATIAGFLWYISLPVEDYEGVTVENDDGNANYIGNDMNGDINNGESN